MEDRVIPFGKYRDLPLKEVPTPYLLWCVRASRRVSARLRLRIDQELQARGFPPLPRPAPPADWPEVMRRWYRELARRYHPDHGGSDEAMKVVNAAHELLRRLLDEPGRPPGG